MSAKNKSPEFDHDHEFNPKRSLQSIAFDKARRGLKKLCQQARFQSRDFAAEQLSLADFLN